MCFEILEQNSFMKNIVNVIFFTLIKKFQISITEIIGK
jgi:hypothetical protein